MRRNLTKAVLVLGAAVLGACGGEMLAPGTQALSPGEALLSAAPKITVCHAAGRAGTTHYVSITVSANGAAAHIRNNGTPKAGHELDYIATADRPCNAPAAAQLTVCTQSSGANADPAASFAYTTSEGDAFSLAFTQCNGPTDVFPGNVTITQAHDINAPAMFSYFATSVGVANGSLVSSSGFSGPPRPTIVEDAIATVSTTSGNNTTVTFYNRN